MVVMLKIPTGGVYSPRSTYGFDAYDIFPDGSVFSDSGVDWDSCGKNKSLLPNSGKSIKNLTKQTHCRIKLQ